MKFSESYGFLIILISLPLLMMLGCVKTDVLVVKPCGKKEKSGPEEKIVLVVGEGNQSQSVTVREVNYLEEKNFKNNPCQISVKQVCFLGLGCFQE